ncbi:Uncharacterised protein [Alysiella crassa]|uniref:Uncharacterized protein n=1 Tax=Alysiella crassa TaxID=153491 RepID=A0A376BMS1_9NEIS|nr:Uncharacterised protein [Alysiella crassa]
MKSFRQPFTTYKNEVLSESLRYSNLTPSPLEEGWGEGKIVEHC